MSKPKLLFTVLIFLVNSFFALSQNKEKSIEIIKTLSSKEMYGRGYVRNGHIKASEYIAKSFSDYNLKTFNTNGSYFQKFSFQINTFPNVVRLKADKKELNLGKSYIVAPFSKGGKGKGKIVYLDSTIFFNDTLAQEFLHKNLKRKVIVYEEKQHNQLMDLGLDFIDKVYSAKSIIKIRDKKLTASLSTSQYSNPIFEVLKDSFPKKIKKIRFELDAELKKETSQNVIGYIKGSEEPDSFIVFTAHYDHLGGMGDVYFPGANDNAAGVAMLLDLAEYYSKNKPKKSIMFIAFGGEEAGLIGSKFYTSKPYFSLNYIRFLVNLDLVGTGSKGATVVNGSVFKKEFNTLKKLNNEHDYLPIIKSRGKAANSDHYFFSEEGVPSFFIYLMGGPSAYHDVNDIPKTLPLTKYNELFKLLVDFENSFE